MQWGGKEGVTAYNSIVTECLGSFQQTVCTALRSERAFGDVKHAVAKCWVWFFCWKLRIKRITLKGALIPWPGTVAISPEAHVCRISSSPRPLKLICNMKEKFWNEQDLCWPSHMRGRAGQWPCGWQSGTFHEIWVGPSLIISIYSGSSCRRLDHWQGQCPIPDPCLIPSHWFMGPCFGYLKIIALLNSVWLQVCKVPVLSSVSQACCHLGHRAGISGRARNDCVSPSGHLHSPLGWWSMWEAMGTGWWCWQAGKAAVSWVHIPASTASSTALKDAICRCSMWPQSSPHDDNVFPFVFIHGENLKKPQH